MANYFLELVSGAEPIKNDKQKFQTCMVSSSLISVASVANYIRSLERFDDFEEGDEREFAVEYVFSFIIPTAYSIYSLSRSVKALKKMDNRSM